MGGKAQRELIWVLQSGELFLSPPGEMFYANSGYYLGKASLAAPGVIFLRKPGVGGQHNCFDESMELGRE